MIAHCIGAASQEDVLKQASDERKQDKGKSGVRHNELMAAFGQLGYGEFLPHQLGVIGDP